MALKYVKSASSFPTASMTFHRYSMRARSILSTNRFTFCLLGKNVWFNQYE